MDDCEEEQNGLELSKEKGVHQVGHDEHAGRFYGEVGSLIEQVHFLHQIFVDLLSLSFFLFVPETYEVVSDAPDFDGDDR